MGLIQTYRFIIADDLAKGALVEVMRQFGGASRPFTLLYAANRHMPHRVRVLVEFLLGNLRDKGRSYRRSVKGPGNESADTPADHIKNKNH